MKWRVMLEQNGELTDARAERCCGRWSATRPSVGCRHRHLAEYFGDRYPNGRLRARATTASASSRRRADPVVAGAQDPVVRGRASASASAPRTSPACCAGTPASRCVARGHDKLSTFGLLPDASVAEVRGYIEQLIGARPAAADRRCVSGAGADGAGRGAAEGRGELSRAWRWRASGAPQKGAPRAAVARRGRIVGGRRSRAVRAAARACGWRSPGRAACRRT